MELNLGQKISSNHYQSPHQANTIIKLIQQQNLTSIELLQHFTKNKNLLKNSQLIQILFQYKSAIYIKQIIKWILQPNQIAMQLHVNDDKHHKLTVQICVITGLQFMKENWCLYQEMYFRIMRGQFEVQEWVKFLDEGNYDEETVYTGLGYFQEIMMPFVKYQFVGVKSLYTKYKIQRPQTYSIMHLFPQKTIKKILKHCHHKQIYDFLTTAYLVSIDDPVDYTAATKLIDLVFQYPQANINIFQRIYSLEQKQSQEQQHRQQQLQLYQLIKKQSMYLENMTNTFKQLMDNMQADGSINSRIIAMTKALLKSKIVYYSVHQLMQCSYINNVNNCSNKQIDQISTPHFNYHHHHINNINNPLSPVPQIKNNPRITLFDPQFEYPQINQQQLIQVLIKIIKKSVYIYYMLSKNDHHLQMLKKHKQSQSVQSIQSSQQLYQQQISEISEDNIFKPVQVQYWIVMQQYILQVQYIFQNMVQINKIVYNNNNEQKSSNGNNQIQCNSGGNINYHNHNQTQNDQQDNILVKKKKHCEYLQFSSGQNIQMITTMKYQYFRLLYNCLLVSSNSIELQHNLQQSQPQFVSIQSSISSQQNQQKQSKPIILKHSKLNLNQLHIIEIIQKYLSENRWNNITHHLLQKIWYILINKHPENLIKNIEKDYNNKKNAESILVYLFDNFIHKDYIYLTTMQFTSHGNLHSLYNISKVLAYSMNGSKKLLLLLKQFQYWQKFIVTDLKKYQQKTYRKIVQPAQNYLHTKSNTSYQQITIDQVDMISKLIQDIMGVSKWPRRSQTHQYSYYYQHTTNQTHKNKNKKTKNKKRTKRNSLMTPSQLMNHQNQQRK